MRTTAPALRKRNYIRVFVGDSRALMAHMLEHREHFDNADVQIFKSDDGEHDVSVIRCGPRVKELVYVDDNVMCPPCTFKTALVRIPWSTRESLMRIVRENGADSEDALRQCRNYGQLIRELVRTVEPRFRTFGDDFEVYYANEWG